MIAKHDFILRGSYFYGKDGWLTLQDEDSYLWQKAEPFQDSCSVIKFRSRKQKQPNVLTKIKVKQLSA